MDLRKQFIDIFGDSNESIRYFAAPGRVNLIGEHIDYCGGFVFPISLSLDAKAVVRKNGTNKVRMAATTLEGIYEFDLTDIEKAKDLKWGNYQAGVVFELVKKGVKVSGFDMLIHGTVPFGSGLSSSAAIELVTGVAVNKMFGGNEDNIQLALAGQAAEHNFCHVNCGIMDQFASGMGKKDTAIMLNCSTLEYKYVPLDLGDHVIVLANTCKKHALGASKYNERRQEVDIGLKMLKRVCARVNLCDYSPEELEKYKRFVTDEVILKRITHVINENARVKEAVRCLENKDLIRFGQLLREANQSIRYLYEATGEELDAMFDAAEGFDGCIGSRMTGGGFGGCTINIVRKDKVDEFIKVVSKKYTEKTGNVGEFYVCQTGDGAREISYEELSC